MFFFPFLFSLILLAQLGQVVKTLHYLNFLAPYFVYQFELMEISWLLDCCHNAKKSKKMKS